MSAENDQRGDKYTYSFSSIDGAYLAAYRVAAADFFAGKKMEEWPPLEGTYEIQFTRLSNAGSVVVITFHKKSAGTTQGTRGGGDQSYEVDVTTGSIVRKYIDR